MSRPMVRSRGGVKINVEVEGRCQESESECLFSLQIQVQCKSNMKTGK